MFVEEGGREGVIITYERQSGGLERISIGLLFPNSVPINGTDVHLCNKPQTHLASGAVESPQCVRISHS